MYQHKEGKDRPERAHVHEPAAFDRLRQILFVRHEGNHRQWKSLSQLRELFRRTDGVIERLRRGA